MSFVQKENPLPSGNSDKGTLPGQGPFVGSHIARIAHPRKKINRAEKFNINFLENVKGHDGQYTARCPAHEDKHNSLSVKIDGDVVLLYCFAGCSVETITGALGLPMSSLFLGESKALFSEPIKQKPHQVNAITYEYLNADGSLAYRKTRYEYSNGSKSFAFFSPGGKKGVAGIKRVPYNLPAVLSAKTVYFVEGEKAANAVIKAGRVATSLDAGANSKWRPEYGKYFQEKTVVILPDNDAPGRKYADFISQNIPGSKIISLPGIPQKGDVYDWLRVGRTMEEIDTLPFTEAETGPDENETPFGEILPSEPGFISVNPFESKAARNRYRWNDIGISNLFADCYKNLCRYVPETKLWYFYGGRVWKPDVGGVLVAGAAKKFMYYLLITCLGFIEDEDTRAAWVEFVSRRMKKQARDTMVADAASCHPVSILEFDKDPYIFNCQNCTLNLKTFTAHKHSPDDFLSKISGVIYDKNAKCERWETFVDEIMCGNAETARFLQKALGYTLTGDTSEECFFILYGSTTRNGKGTTMETTLRLMGDYGRAAQPETVAQKQYTGSGSPSEDIARLKGARFVNMSEPDKGLRLNSALVKQVTGGDTVTARFLHQNSFEYRPEYKLFINTNHLPRVTDDSIFASGRVKLIPFERHFGENEQDKGLKAFFKEQGNISGIFNWFIEGLALMQAEGLTQPEAVRNATEQYREESDIVGLFVGECLMEIKQAKTPFKEIYSEYEKWCDDNGLNPLNRHNLAAELRRKGMKIDRGDKGTRFLFGFCIVSTG